jgi:hypothetical protein
MGYLSVLMCKLILIDVTNDYPAKCPMCGGELILLNRRPTGALDNKLKEKKNDFCNTI